MCSKYDTTTVLTSALRSFKGVFKQHEVTKDPVWICAVFHTTSNCR